MIVKLTNSQFDYLDHSLSDARESLRLKLHTTIEKQLVIIEVDEDTAGEIHDWAIEELQKKGFDLNYELTDDGKKLEELIDAFHVE